jgi:hypothetical protein
MLRIGLSKRSGLPAIKRVLSAQHSGEAVETEILQHPRTRALKRAIKSLLKERGINPEQADKIKNLDQLNQLSFESFDESHPADTNYSDGGEKHDEIQERILQERILHLKKHYGVTAEITTFKEFTAVLLELRVQRELKFKKITKEQAEQIQTFDELAEAKEAFKQSNV